MASVIGFFVFPVALDVSLDALTFGVLVGCSLVDFDVDVASVLNRLAIFDLVSSSVDVVFAKNSVWRAPHSKFSSVASVAICNRFAG